MNRTEQILTDMNVESLFYYDGNTTICLLLKDDKAVSRGVSICSKRDNFIKRVGRAKALGRAIQAMVNQSSSGRIYPERFPDDYSEELRYAAKEFGCRSKIAPKLTIFEKNIINKKSLIGEKNARNTTVT